MCLSCALPKHHSQLGMLLEYRYRAMHLNIVYALKHLPTCAIYLGSHAVLSQIAGNTLFTNGQ